MPDLDALAIFVAVAETSSFSTAAGRLGLTKGTVSRAVARLEEDVGADLFHRTSRHVALSTAGVALYERTAPHVVALRHAVGQLPESEEQPSGLLRVTAPNDLGSSLLPPLFARFLMLHPAVQLDVRLTNRVVDVVGEGFDLAIRARAPDADTDGVATDKLCAMEAHTYAAPTYVARRGEPRGIDDPDHDWVMFGPAQRFGVWPKHIIPRVVADDFIFVQQTLQAGVGVGMLPTFLADEAVKHGLLVRVLPSFKLKSPGFSLVYPKSKHLPRKVVAFRDFLTEQVGDH